MIYLYTENFFWLPRAKNRLKKILGLSQRGPQAVIGSLESGLRQLNIDYKINQPLPRFAVAVGVISGVKTLLWALKQKSAGKITRLVAGPNLVVLPGDSGGVLKDPLIDVVVVPSPWVGESYVELYPPLKSKIRVWPAGVSVPDQVSGGKSLDFLIYNKIGQTQLFKKIRQYLEEKKYSFKVISYGQFNQAEYFELLKDARFEIYLSNSESQGLAMFEAWARDVPTLVWDRGYFELPGYRLNKSAASPYLSPKAGMSFKNLEDFSAVLPGFVAAAYEPREYVLRNFSHALCAQRYLEILGNQPR